MDFLDSVVKSSNALIKERLNNPFGKQADSALSDLAQSSPPVSGEPSSISSHNASTIAASSQDQPSIEFDDEPALANSTDKFAAIAADAEAVRKNAVKGAKNIGTFLFSIANKAGQTVTQTAKQVKQAVENTSILTDLSREQQEFIKELGSSIQAGELPWAEYQLHDQLKANEIREQILTLSQDKRNFVRNPPSEANFEFDPQKSYSIALSLLREDPNLSKMRYELIPKLVDEDTFWRNYFYRVSMLKQQIIDGNQEGQSNAMTTRAQAGWSSSRSSSGEGPDEVTSTEETSHLAEDTANASFSFEKTSSYVEPPTNSQEETSQNFFVDDNDLKNKLKELNIGSLDDGQDG